MIDHRTLKSSFVWGQVRDAEERTLNSVLEEVVFQAGKNKVYGRAEALPRVEPALCGVRAYAAGYERTVMTRGPFTLYGGGSYTRDAVPVAFQSAYGSGPRGLKASFRIKWDVTRMLGK